MSFFATIVNGNFSVTDSSSDEIDVRTRTKRNEATEYTGRNILYN